MLTSEGPRPTCPECGKVVDPTRAEPITPEGSRLPESRVVRYALLGIYCSADCAIDSWKRGYPIFKLRRRLKG